ncbi:MAG: LamG domain-containing protein, partial [Chitinophagaceae bacterium]|nr:LamG domain-containing protein [Chitinophagaceae bacterium]
MRFFISFICLLSYSTLLGQIGPGSLDCSQWLSLPTYPSFVDIGDLDISGNQITIEALINRTGPYNPGVGDGNEGDIVSKHWDPTNVNYLLRLNHVFITTENGFFQTGDPCPIELNKTYHVALVYDGVTLKYFRDGFLLSSTPATGNLIQSDLPARIGLYSGTIVENLIGYINEVRIWNVARTQEQIRTFMSGSLPSPTTQPGLLAYYHFNNLLNKQGNTAWNGSLGGFATINSSNPDCENNPDSCGQSFSPYIINDYTPVTGLDVCNNRITVEDATAFNPGDTVLIIQMQGALADTSNSTLFGDVTANHNAGHHEFNIINSINGNSIYLLNSILRSYDVPEGKVQLVRVPYFTNFEVSAPLSCPEWNGKTGGVLVLTVKDTLTLNADIDVSAKGFRGGLDPAINSPTPNCNENDFSFPANSPLASGKGEGYALLSANHALGKGRIANGGGGGNSYKSGGGGGGNGGRGGLGGYQFEAAPCNSTIPFANGGLDGRESINSNFETRIGLGGGGGAGHSNNQTGFKADGGAGGGLAIIKCDVLKNNGHSIISNGENAPECGNNTPGCLVGSGGGGAGGTLVLVSNTIQNPLPVSLNGGKGADLWAGGAGKAGPGGGGGGGSIMVSNSSLP